MASSALVCKIYSPGYEPSLLPLPVIRGILLNRAVILDDVSNTCAVPSLGALILVDGCFLLTFQHDVEVSLYYI